MTTAKPKPSTLRDVARAANVSYQTVSLVVNDKPGVSAGTRQRIRKLLTEFDYRPNLGAQMLSTKRSNMLELILVDVKYAGRLADTTQMMAQAAKVRGYHLLVSETTAEELAETVSSARSRLVDGVILYAPRLQIGDEKLAAIFSGLPFVRRDYVPTSGLPWVGFDQDRAARIATEHLLALSHTQIAAIPPEPAILNGARRAQICREVLLGHGLTPGPVAYGDYSIASGYTAAETLLASGQPFTAVVAGTDMMALGAIRAFKDAGLKVPEDVSIVGFDNTEFAAYIEPPLTTVSFAFANQDELTVKYLLERISSPESAPHQRVLSPELVVRASTCPPGRRAGNGKGAA